MIAKEGWLFLIPLILITFPLGIVAHSLNHSVFLILYYILGFSTLFLIYFFRDPLRKLPDDLNSFVSPADGKIISVKSLEDDDIGQTSHEISIYLNLLSVHVVRSPFQGVVKSVERKKGRFIPAFEHNAGDVNETNTIVIKSQNCKYKIRQVAGLIARRIICYAKINQDIQKGSRLGFIRFGSRVDIIVSSNVNIIAKEGDRVLGGKTVIAELRS
tara:strand:- start:530 stop:1174 length:645 start_codon:yes stop_codon:yes gene_type:complete